MNPRTLLWSPVFIFAFLVIFSLLISHTVDPGAIYLILATIGASISGGFAVSASFFEPRGPKAMKLDDKRMRLLFTGKAQPTRSDIQRLVNMARAAKWYVDNPDAPDSALQHAQKAVQEAEADD